MQSFIFGGDTGVTYDQIQRQRAMADQLRSGSSQNRTGHWSDGLRSAGQDIAAALLDRRADKREQEGRDAATERLNEITRALVAGAPENKPAGVGSGTGRTIDASPLPSFTEPPQDNDVRSQVAQALLGKGYSPTVTAGILGNIQQESAFDTGAVGDNGNSFGMAQWNGPRRHAFKAFAQERGMDPASVDAQVAFLDHELQGSESAALQAMQGAGTPEEAALIGSQKFWRPGIPHNENRQRYAGEAAGIVEALMGAPQGQQTVPQQQVAGQTEPQQPNNRMAIAMQLMGAASDPFVNDGQRQVAMILAQQLMPQQPETMSPYQQAQIDLRREQMAQSQANRAQEMQMRQAGTWSPGTNVTVTNQQAPQIGSIERGYQVFQDPETGAYRAEPIPGGSVDRDLQAQQDARANASENTGRAANVVLEDIGRFRELVEGQGWFDPVTGIGGMLAGWVPGSSAADADGLAQTIKANIGFDQLQSMREASPTGGALGNVTERELADLQAVLGNLSRSQSEEQLLRNLERLDGMYRTIMEKAAAYPNAAEFGFGAPPVIEMPEDLSTVSDEELRRMIMGGGQ